MGVKERQEREREAVARAILDAARDLFVAAGLSRTSRSARLPSGSSTARRPSTAISRARTTSSSRSPRKGFRSCSSPSRGTPRRRGRQIRSTTHPAPVLALLRVQQGPSRVFRADVPRPQRSRASARTGSGSASSVEMKHEMRRWHPAARSTRARFRPARSAARGLPHSARRPCTAPRSMRLCDRLAAGRGRRRARARHARGRAHGAASRGSRDLVPFGLPRADAERNRSQDSS